VVGHLPCKCEFQSSNPQDHQNREQSKLLNAIVIRKCSLFFVLIMVFWYQKLAAHYFMDMVHIPSHICGLGTFKMAKSEKEWSVHVPVPHIGIPKGKYFSKKCTVHLTELLSAPCTSKFIDWNGENDKFLFCSGINYSEVFHKRYSFPFCHDIWQFKYPLRVMVFSTDLWSVFLYPSACSHWYVCLLYFS
jgi:hypothetical protein